MSHSIYSQYNTAAGGIYDPERWTPKQVAAIHSALEKAGVKYCVGAYVDIHGVPKGKFLPLSHFPEFTQGSELYTGYALDGLGQRPNDDEIASVPDLGLIIPLPWNPKSPGFPPTTPSTANPTR